MRNSDANSPLTISLTCLGKEDTEWEPLILQSFISNMLLGEIFIISNCNVIWIHVITFLHDRRPAIANKLHLIYPYQNGPNIINCVTLNGFTFSHNLRTFPFSSIQKVEYSIVGKGLGLCSEDSKLSQWRVAMLLCSLLLMELKPRLLWIKN